MESSRRSVLEDIKSLTQSFLGREKIPKVRAPHPKACEVLAIKIIAVDHGRTAAGVRGNGSGRPLAEGNRSRNPRARKLNEIWNCPARGRFTAKFNISANFRQAKAGSLRPRTGRA